MSFTGLQRKGKLEKNSKGTFKRRKRFGKSLLNASPAMLISIIDRKLGYLDKFINEVDTNTFRASQYNHITDEYKKKKLSERTVQIGNEKVQRDLYSAFLLMNSRLDLKGTNRDKCLERFESFIENHNSVIAEIINSNIKRPISFGF